MLACMCLIWLAASIDDGAASSDQHLHTMHSDQVPAVVEMRRKLNAGTRDECSLARTDASIEAWQRVSAALTIHLV
jgi:hypothetical protein